ncbi:MAG TPA: rhodanese-like domain-containing protein [Gaiellaceae bacterium]|jgi:rhodanese-related sulfurtransferase|nr:rhodanese-like domain-containing protein [Gaiellaceae bacterium]
MSEIHPTEARSLLEAGALALDVRELDEWQHSHIRDALHIPLGELAQRLHELPTGRRIVAVCRSGTRSGLIVGALRQRGYDVVNLDGGLLAWHAHGLPLEPAAGGVA